MGKRTKSREMTLQALYAYELTLIDKSNLLNFDWLKGVEKLPTDIKLFAKELITGTINNLNIIDEKIRVNLSNWRFEQISTVDLSILRMSVYALLYMKEIPFEVTIDEAVDLAKKYGSNESFRFVNGVLDGVRREFN